MVDTQAEIIKAAITCFDKTGFEPTTFKKIALSVGVTQPLLYRYFKNKMDLFGACCISVAVESRTFVDNYIDQRSSAADRLLAYLNGNLEWFGKHKNKAQILIGMYYFAFNDPNISRINNEISEIGTARVETHLAQIEHELGKEFKDLSRVARIIHNFLVGEIIKLQRSNGNSRSGLTKEVTSEFIKELIQSSLQKK